MTASLDASAYYATYHGHAVEHLEVAHERLRRSHNSIAFLAGDSSLDNKFWFGRMEPALNGYEDFLRPPRMKTDVCYWLNYEAVRRDLRHLCCLNTAIEATSLNGRACCCLLEQDCFIHQHITSNDYLIVSVGGNDIALKPVLCTILNILLLTYCTPQACIEHLGCACPPNFCLDDGCFCCGLPGCVTGLVGCPPGLGYFVNLFGNIIKNYILRIIGCSRPMKVLVCMIYFPDECATGGWADGSLSLLRYDDEPEKLQTLIKTVFQLATSRICLPGTEVVPVPLFEALDGKTSSDYVARVEPSATGGAKMAAMLMDALLGEGTFGGCAAPQQQNMVE